MNNEIISFNYSGAVIPFALTGNDVMINATEMAKACGKRVFNYTRNSGFQDLVNEVSSVTQIRATELVVTIQSGTPQSQGTWFHRLIAIHFAMWCSPRFGVWCLQKLDEIIQRGYAFRDAEIQRLTQENNNLQGMIQSMQPQVSYYNDILTCSENLYSTEQVCKELGLGISSKTLLSKLENIGFIYRRSDNKWFLSSNYDNLGYLRTITVKDNKTGKPRNLRRWTEEGKHWIWSLRKKLG